LSIDNKDWFLLLAGFALSIVSTALWDWWKVRTRRQKQVSEAINRHWAERLNHRGFTVRADASNEIIVRSMYWFVIGNIMFAISGFTTFFGLFGGLASAAVSGVALVALSASLRWLRMFLRLKKDLAVIDATIAERAS
jgi:hypothetical protein